MPIHLPSSSNCAFVVATEVSCLQHPRCSGLLLERIVGFYVALLRSRLHGFRFPFLLGAGTKMLVVQQKRHRTHSLFVPLSDSRVELLSKHSALPDLFTFMPFEHNKDSAESFHEGREEHRANPDILFGGNHAVFLEICTPNQHVS